MNTIIKQLIATKEISNTIQNQEQQLYKLREKIELQNPQIQEIAKIGFTAVIHKEHISFVNYSKKKLEENDYYSIDLELDPPQLKKRREDVTDQDVQKIANILKLEEAQAELAIKIKYLQTRRSKKMTRAQYDQTMGGLSQVRAHLKDGPNKDPEIAEILGAAQSILLTQIDFAKLKNEENPFHQIERLEGGKK